MIVKREKIREPNNNNTAMLQSHTSVAFRDENISSPLPPFCFNVHSLTCISHLTEAI